MVIFLLLIGVYPECHPLLGLQYYTCGKLEWLESFWFFNILCCIFLAFGSCPLSISCFIILINRHLFRSSISCCNIAQVSCTSNFWWSYSNSPRGMGKFVYRLKQVLEVASSCFNCSLAIYIVNTYLRKIRTWQLNNKQHIYVSK